MPVSNKYVYRWGVSEAKFRQRLKLFCLDLTATQTAEITGLSRNSVNKYLKAIRQRIARFCEAASSIATVGEAIMGWWIWAMPSTCGSITAAMNSLVVPATSMELRDSGALQKPAWLKVAECIGRRSICI